MSEGLSDQCLKLRISTIFGKGSFALRRKSENSGADSEIVSVVFDAAFASLERRVASLETTLRLGSFSVYDNTSTGSIHRQVVRVKNEKPPTEAASGVDALKEPLLFVNFVQSPLDGHADSTVTVRVKALEVVYHKGYVEAVINFFRPPKRQLESMAALLVSLQTMTVQRLGLTVIHLVVRGDKILVRAPRPRPRRLGVRSG